MPAAQLVEVNFPAGQRVSYETGARDADIHQQVWMLEGAMEITVGDSTWRLKSGDGLAMWLDSPTAFRNPTRKRARHLVALTTSPVNDRRNR